MMPHSNTHGAHSHDIVTPPKTPCISKLHFSQQQDREASVSDVSQEHRKIWESKIQDQRCNIEMHDTSAQPLQGRLGRSRAQVVQEFRIRSEPKTSGCKYRFKVYNLKKIFGSIQHSDLLFKKQTWLFTLQGINISHLGKRKIIFKMPFLGDMLVPWRVCLQGILSFALVSQISFFAMPGDNEGPNEATSKIDGKRPRRRAPTSDEKRSLLGGSSHDL